MTLEFGQPRGGVCQFAYAVEDIERSAERFTRELGVGPWFVRGPFQPPEGRYRGQPTQATFTLARGFTGHVMVELVKQHDDSPSVYNEDGGRHHGFHHWAVFPEDFDRALGDHLARGYEEAFADRLPSGSRIVYVDTKGDLPGMIELVEHTEAQEAVYTKIWRASLDWDGSDLLRMET
ncbi:MAG TPA: VOC family protein [Solirubrobacteraceae bacterium]|nr:VOC family protein [Solirubrobacteraceae bacterium]